jgi:thiol-disulfide isomerase/thioredoxin
VVRIQSGCIPASKLTKIDVSGTIDELRETALPGSDGRAALRLGNLTKRRHEGALWCQKVLPGVLIQNNDATRAQVLCLRPFLELAMSFRLAVLEYAWVFCIALAVAGSVKSDEQSIPPPQPGLQTAAEQSEKHVTPRVAGTTSQPVYSSYRCVAAEDGKPLGDAEVHFHFYRAKPSRMILWKSARTDRDGVVTFDGELTAADTDALGRAQVSVRVPGRATRVIFYQQTNKEAGPLELRIGPASTLKGRVVDEWGNGVSDATVFVGVPHIRGVHDTVTDVDGEFAIDDLEAWEAKPEPPFYITGLAVHASHPKLGKGYATVSQVPNKIVAQIGLSQGSASAGTRVESSEHAIALAQIRKDFGKRHAPAIVGTKWFNASAEVSLEKLKGKVVLLDFWGTWCRPCVETLPAVESLHKKYGDRGLVVIGIHSELDADNVAAFLEHEKLSFPITIDTGETAKNYGIDSWPTYFLIDKTGKAQLAFSSSLPSEEEIERLLRQMDD